MPRKILGKIKPEDLAKIKVEAACRTCHRRERAGAGGQDRGVIRADCCLDRAIRCLPSDCCIPTWPFVARGSAWAR